MTDPGEWGFEIEVVCSAPEFPERRLFDEAGGPPPEEMIVQEAVSPQESEGKAKEPPPKGPPAFEPEFQEYQQELAEHNRIGSAIALGASVLILVAALIPAVGRLSIIGSGPMLGGELMLLYGVILALQAQSPLLRFSRWSPA